MVAVLLDHHHLHHPWRWCCYATTTTITHCGGAAKLPPPPSPMVVVLLSHHHHQHDSADEWGRHCAAARPSTAAPMRPCTVVFRPHRGRAPMCIANVFTTASRVRRRIVSMSHA